MAINDLNYYSLAESETEMVELDNEIREKLELHRDKMENAYKYDPNIDGRKALESLYERRINLAYRIAKTFHPFSQFGRMCLGRAQEITDEYEREVGILTTRITKENISSFRGSLTADMAEDITTGKYQAIGALRYNEDGVYGVGALVYMMDMDRLDDEYILRIKWLFVKEAFRERGIATALLGGLLWKSLVLETENILFEAPVNPEWNQVYYDILTDWHFDFEVGFSPQLYLRLDDVEIDNEINKLAAQASPLKKLPEANRKKASDMIAEKDDSFYLLLNRKLPDGYIDEELSCFHIDGGEFKGALMVHTLPSGTVRIEYLSGEPKSCMILLSYMIKRAKEICEGDTLLELVSEYPETDDYFDSCFEHQIRMSVIMAALTPAYGNEDMELEDIEAILDKYFKR